MILGSFFSEMEGGSPMGLDSGSLIKTLNKTCLDALQAAAGLCLSRTNPSVASKSASLSPGKPTMKSEVSAISGLAARIRSTRRR